MSIFGKVLFPLSIFFFLALDKMLGVVVEVDVTHCLTAHGDRSHGLVPLAEFVVMVMMISMSMVITMTKKTTTTMNVFLICTCVHEQVGFTTDPTQARSTEYCSDLGKSFEVSCVLDLTSSDMGDFVCFFARNKLIASNVSDIFE